MNRHCTGSHAPRVLKIAQRYGLKAASWEDVNSHYHVGAAIRVRTNQGDMLIKPFRGSVERVRSMTSAVNHLWAEGYRYMPKLQRTRDGHLYTVVGGRPHYMTAWVHGQPLDGTPKQLRKLGTALAELHETSWSPSGHRSSQGHSQKVRNQSSSVLYRRLKMLRAYDNEFRLAGESTLVDSDSDSDASRRRWLERRQSEINRLADMAWTRLEDPALDEVRALEESKPANIHGDVTKFNVVVTPEGAVKLIDWDGLSIGSRWIELVTTLSNTTQFDPSAMKAFLQGYERIRPLSSPERSFIAALFALPREAWYARQMKDGEVVWHDGILDVFASTWSARLHAVEWMNDWVKRH